MLSWVALRAGELLAAAVIAGMLLLAGATAAVWWLSRQVRRRVQAALLVATGRVRRAGARGYGMGQRRLWSSPLPDRHWIAAGRARWKLRRAVGSAEHAVAMARQTGAPVGDLDGLCWRLRAAAADVGRQLAIKQRAAAAGSDPDSAASQASHLMAVATQIQAAAAAAAASISRPVAACLADDVHQEVVALSAGLAAAAASPRSGGVPEEAG